jgi:glutamate--cysteine ligase
VATGVTLSKQFTESLQRYQLPKFETAWGAIRRGIEKESLRISPEGHISQAGHPKSLGASLTNPFITTDFSEALLEFITPAYAGIGECLQKLDDIHRFTFENLDHNEMLWVTSMPCPLSADTKIPIAQYGISNIGKLKTLYRHGLSHRYGSLMQTISGLHYNFSMPDSFWLPYKELCDFEGDVTEFRTQKYLHLIRNFHRYSWLLIYLFGASPAACKCFVQGREHSLDEFDDTSLYLSNATCLRMGNLGYKSEAQESLFVCYNELNSYVECLDKAMRTPYPKYEEIGANANGEFVQINSNLLQLENEFYSTIRPKRNVSRGERPLDALTANGIEYIEVRALDLNPYLPLGIDSEQIRFLDTFLLHCLLSESPHCNESEFFEIAKNMTAVVEHGRDKDLTLNSEGKPKKLREWAGELIEELGYAAGLLDHTHNTSLYEESLQAQVNKVINSDLTPSGKMLKAMRAGNLSFFEFSMQQSRKQNDYFKQKRLNEETNTFMKNISRDSLVKQQEIENADTISFEDFLKDWNST